MTDFEKEMISLCEWLMRRTEELENGGYKTDKTHIKYFLKDFTVEKYKGEKRCITHE